MTRQCLAIFLALSSAAGCKGETKTVDNPQTKSDLDACRKNAEEKDKLVKAVQDENDYLRAHSGSGSGGEITVVFEGTNIQIKAGTGGTINPPVDPKVATATSQEFLDLVNKSRGAIQKCYEGALKKNAGIQAKTITLTINASFSPTGAYKDSSFSPSLGDAFDTCIKGVATHWVMPQPLQLLNFKAPVSLTPS